MSSDPSMPYLVRTSALTPNDFQRSPHRLDLTAVRDQVWLGNQTGLTKTGVHLYRVPPRTLGMVLHWHTTDDEWVYVLEAGPNSVMRIKEGTEAEKEVEVKKGDFFGFKAGSGVAHAMKSGEGEVVYLVGGSREDIDVCHYPDHGKTFVKNGAGIKAGHEVLGYHVDDEHMEVITKF